MAYQFQGFLRDIPAVQFFHLIDLTKKSGTYCLYRPSPTAHSKTAQVQPIVGDEQARIVFDRGTFVYAMTPGPDSQLGMLLQKVGTLTPQQYGTLQSGAAGSGDKALAMALINANYAKQRDIVQTLRFHMLDIVYDAMAATEGFFVFEENELPPAGAITVRINIDNIIADATRRRLELNELMQLIPSLDMVLKLNPPPQGSTPKVELKPEEWHVISSVDGKRTIGQIARAWNMPEIEIRRVVARLLRTGLVESIGNAKSRTEAKSADTRSAAATSKLPAHMPPGNTPDSIQSVGTAIPIQRKGRLNIFMRKPFA